MHAGNTGEGTSKNPELLLDGQAWISDGTNTPEHPRSPGNSSRSRYMITFPQNRDDQDLLWNVCEFFNNSRCCGTQPVSYRASQTGPTPGSVCTWERDLLRVSFSNSWLDKVVDRVHIRNTEAFWVEPWLFFWPFCWVRSESKRSAEPWRPPVD